MAIIMSWTIERCMGFLTRRLVMVVTSILGMLVLEPTGFAQQPKNEIEKFYVFYCGDIALNDMGRFSPGYSGPGVLSVTCYLIKHSQGWLLFDTGLGDQLVN